VDISIDDGPRTITVADIYQGKATPEAVDIADAILTHLADQGRPVAEADIIAAVGVDKIYCRNILCRLAVDGIAEALPGGRYQIPDYPPRPVDLPDQCPIQAGGPVPTGCRFHPKLFRTLYAQGVIPLPGGRCPLRSVCGLEYRS